MNKTIKKVLAIRSFSVVWCVLIFVPDALLCQEPKQDLFVDTLAQAHMPAFPWKEQDWEEQDYATFLKESVAHRISPQPRRKRETVLEFHKKIEEKNPKSMSSVFNGKTTWDDLNLFCGDADRQSYVAKKIDKTFLELGTARFLLTLATPTDNMNVLRKRQEIFQFFLEHEQLFTELRSILQSCQEAENVMLSFWRIDNFKHASKRSYFNIPGFRWLNSYRHLLSLKSAWGHFKRTAMWSAGNTIGAGLIFSFAIMKLIDHKPSEEFEQRVEGYKSSDLRMLLSLLDYEFVKPIKDGWDSITKQRFVSAALAAGTGTMIALNLPETYKWTYQNFLIEDCLHKIMIRVAQFVNSMRAIYKTIAYDRILREYEEFSDLIIFFEQTVPNSKKLTELLWLLEKNTFTEPSSALSNKGNVLRTFRLMHETKETFEPALIAIGNIDKMAGIAQFYQEAEGSDTPICFVRYKTTEKPLIDLQDFWHPLIDSQVVVPNSLTVGAHGQRPNIIVTGPNAGGKSTTLKAVAINVVMAQTFGIALARSMSLSLFSLIATYLNITDDIGVGNSLFKAEVKRTDKLLQDIATLQPGQHSFIIFDEIFNGTSPLEGMASAYSVANYLATLENTICLLATHFKLLTELEENTDSFANYKVSVVHDQDGRIGYPYKLEKGISDQHVAIDILKEEGFDSHILYEAQEIVRKQAR